MKTTGEKGEKGEGMDRREALGVMAIGAYGVGVPDWLRFRTMMESGQAQARFFSDAELATVRVLADLLIPRDDKSGSATDAGVPDYMDFVIGISSDTTKRQWHEGLAWFDAEAGRRFTKPFVQCDDTQRGQILDDIAWPARARPELRAASDFFTRVRDLVGAGFFSSRMGIQDLGYVGNVFNPHWQGAPPEALAPLGLSYEEWDRKYGTHAAPRAGRARR